MSYTLCNGFEVLNLEDACKSILDLLINSKEEADDFVFNFLLSCEDEEEAVTDYRVYRFEEKNITEETFFNIQIENSQKALEGLFLQSLTEHEFGFIMEMINSGQTSFKKIFKNFKENPRGNWKRLIL